MVEFLIPINGAIMFSFFKSYPREIELRDRLIDHKPCEIAVREHSEIDILHQLEKIANKLTRRSSCCRKLYPVGKRLKRGLRDSALIGVGIGLACAFGVVVSISSKESRKQQLAEWNFNNEVKFFNKTCGALLSPYTDIWHFCRMDFGGAPSEYWKPCNVFASDTGLCSDTYLGMFVLAVFVAIMFVAFAYYSLLFKSKDYAQPVLANWLLDAEEKSFLSENLIEVTERDTGNDVILKINSKIIAKKTKLLPDIWDIIDGYLGDNVKENASAKDFLKLVRSV